MLPRTQFCEFQSGWIYGSGRIARPTLPPVRRQFSKLHTRAVHASYPLEFVDAAASLGWIAQFYVFHVPLTFPPAQFDTLGSSSRQAAAVLDYRLHCIRSLVCRGSISTYGVS
jgi:hypothetical protein